VAKSGRKEAKNAKMTSAANGTRGLPPDKNWVEAAAQYPAHDCARLRDKKRAKTAIVNCQKTN
jgi:hypothetical protein